MGESSRLSWFDDLSSDDYELQRQAAVTLRELAVNHENKRDIGRMGAIRPLIGLLGGDRPAAVHEQAAAALRALARNDVGNQTQIEEQGGIAPLVRLLSSSEAAVREQSAAALTNLACSHRPNQTAIHAAGAIVPLVNLLGAEEAAGMRRALLAEAAAGALFNLALNPECAASLFHIGGIPKLVKLLESGTPLLQGRAAGTLRNMGANRVGGASLRVAVARAGAIPHLVRLLSSRDTMAVQQACAALKDLAATSARERGDISKAGAIRPLLALVSNEEAPDLLQEHAAILLMHLMHRNPQNLAEVRSAA